MYSRKGLQLPMMRPVHLGKNPNTGNNRIELILDTNFYIKEVTNEITRYKLRDSGIYISEGEYEDLLRSFNSVHSGIIPSKSPTLSKELFISRIDRIRDALDKYQRADNVSEYVSGCSSVIQKFLADKNYDQNVEALIWCFDIQDSTNLSIKLSRRQYNTFLQLIKDEVKHWASLYGAQWLADTGDGGILSFLINNKHGMKEWEERKYYISHKCIECILSVDFVMREIFSPLLELRNINWSGIRNAVDLGYLIVSSDTESSFTYSGPTMNVASKIQQMSDDCVFSIGEDVCKAINEEQLKYFIGRIDPKFRKIYCDNDNLYQILSCIAHLTFDGSEEVKMTVQKIVEQSIRASSSQ
ncbi:hypothetical protein KDL44_11390 [bacterium]|nr:hypothetical protein [bacterium]